MGDFNRNFYKIPHFATDVEALGYNMYPPNHVWTWHKPRAEPPQQSTIDFVFFPKSLPQASATSTQFHPVCTDHKLLMVSFDLPIEPPLSMSSTVPKLFNLHNTQPESWKQFAQAHDQWSATASLHPTLRLTDWTEQTLKLLIQHCGPPTTQKHHIQTPWTDLMKKKRAWTRDTYGIVPCTQTSNKILTPQQQTAKARKIASRAKGGLFRPLSQINDATGTPLTGPMMMDELATQMATKQSPARPLFPIAPPINAEPGLNVDMDRLQQGIHNRKDSAPGKTTLTAKVFKHMGPHSLHHLKHALNKSTALTFIEPCIRIILHLPLKKRTPVQSEEDTRPIMLEEELVKIICNILLLQGSISFEDSTQSAYQPGRSTIEGRKMAVFAFAYALENHTLLILYKRDKTNAYGRVDTGQLAAMLASQGIPPRGATWFQQYVQQGRIQSVTQYGTSRTWAFGMGLFQGNPLGPLAYLIQEDSFHQAVEPKLKPSIFIAGTHIIPVTAERYSDDSFFMSLDPPGLDENIQTLNSEGPPYGQLYNPSKEHSLTFDGQRRSLQLDLPNTAKSTSHNLRKGMTILGSQVCLVATDWYADNKIRQAIAVWESSTSQVTDLKQFVLMYNEHVASTLMHQSHTNFPKDDTLQQWEKSVGRVLRKHLHCIPKLSKSKLWDQHLMSALPFTRLHNICWRAATHSLLKTLNTPRKDLATWAQYRWQMQNPHPLSDEARLHTLLARVHLQVAALLHTAEQQDRWPSVRYTLMEYTYLLPYLSRTHKMYLYTDGSKTGIYSGAAIVLQVGLRYFPIRFKLPPGFDIQHCEVVAMAGARFLAHWIQTQGFNIEEIVADSTNALFWTMKDDKTIKDPFLRAMKASVPIVACRMCWWKSHQKLTSIDPEDIRRHQRNKQVDTHAGHAAHLQGMVTLPYLLPPIFVLIDYHTNSVQTYKHLHWPVAPWDVPAVESTMTIARLAATHRKHPQAFCTTYPLLFDTWTARGLWHEGYKLPKCCKVLPVGGRHKCPCQYSAWEQAFQVSAPPTWTLIKHHQDITIHCQQKLVAVMGNKSTLITHSWAGVPLHRDLVPLDNAFAPIWGRTVMQYFTNAQHDRWG